MPGGVCPLIPPLANGSGSAKGASQGMTTQQGQPFRQTQQTGRPPGKLTRTAAKRAEAMANSMQANERRRRREPPVIDWDEAIANLLDILDDIYDERRG
jgi:hypothetical protein